jgi:pentalenolactone synthase
MSIVDEPTVLPFDENLSSMEMVERYWRFQEDEPIAKVRTVVGDPAWLVSRYDDVKALLGDQRLGRSHPDPDHAPRWTASLGGGPHMDFATEMAERKAIRNVLAAPFSPARVAALRPLADSTATELLEAIATSRTPVDCHSTFAAPLPQRVTGTYLGIPAGDVGRGVDRFMQSANVLIASSAGEPEQPTNAMDSLTEFAGKLLAAKRANPGDDVLTELVRARDVHGQLNEGQVLFTALILLMSASDSTTVRINIAVRLLLAHPEQYAAVVRDPTLVPGAVDEILRMSNGIYDPTIRYARTDFELRDVPIKAGDLVLLDVTAAHCDTRVFPDPLKFDVSRNPNRHIAFGYGFTRCVGATIARLNLEAAVGSLAHRFVALPFTPPQPTPDRPLAML